MAEITKAKILSMRKEAAQMAGLFAFLADAWDGTGGFAPVFGAIQPDSSERGSTVALPSYAESSYLHRHPRERGQKYARRRARATYTNLLRRALGTWLSFLLREQFRRETTTPQIADWLLNCDGRGTKWEDLFSEWCTWTALFGTSPMVVDRPVDPEARSRGEQDAGVVATIWSPGCVADWRLGVDRGIEMLRLLYQVEVERGWADAPTVATRTKVWTRSEWEEYEVDDRGNVRPVGELPMPQPFDLGEVPVVVAQFAPPARGALFGYTPAIEVGILGRQDFNDASGLDEHLAAAVFALLCWPADSTLTPENLAKALKIGTSSAVRVPIDAKFAPSYLSPDKSVADTLFARRDRTREEAYRALHLENLLQSTAQPTSALARQYERANLDAALREYARRMVAADRRVIRLVALFNGLDQDAVLADYRCEPPDDFDIEDVQTLLDNARRAFELPLDDVTKIAIIRKVSDATAKLSDTERDERDKVLDELREAMAVLPPPADANDVQAMGHDSADQQPDVPPAAGATRIELGVDALVSIMTMNEARASQGLGPLTRVDGSRDPDGDLIVADFQAKREALRSAQAQEPAVVAQATEEEGGPVLDDAHREATVEDEGDDEADADETEKDKDDTAPPTQRRPRRRR